MPRSCKHWRCSYRALLQAPSALLVGGGTQILFCGVYLATQALAMRLMARSDVAPPWTLALVALSKRVHSIYLLRLFNDCWAQLLVLAALEMLCSRAWVAAITLFSAAVSVKMSALLFAPGVLAVCLLVRPRLRTALRKLSRSQAHVLTQLRLSGQVPSFVRPYTSVNAKLHRSDCLLLSMLPPQP